MFYVTVIDAGRVGVLVGPFDSETEAREWVEPARSAAIRVDPFAHFYAFGVTRIGGLSRPGMMNRRVGYAPTADALPSR